MYVENLIAQTTKVALANKFVMQIDSFIKQEQAGIFGGSGSSWLTTAAVIGVILLVLYVLYQYYSKQSPQAQIVRRARRRYREDYD